MDLYAQELKVWKECAEYRESLHEVAGTGGSENPGSGSGTEESGRVVTVECKVPGAFEW